MPNRRADDPQPRLFHEVVETVVTPDCVVNDGVWLAPPPGRGWRVHDAHRERHTAWMRRRPVVVRVWKHRGGMSC